MGQGGIAYTKLAQSGGQSRRASKQAKVTAEDKAERDCYKLADARDGGKCRVCQRRVTKGGGLLWGAIHHHLIYRSGISVSQGRHHSSNVVTICRICDDAVHVEATLRLEGDADARDAVTGKLAGVKVERYSNDGGWQVEKFV